MHKLVEEKIAELTQRIELVSQLSEAVELVEGILPGAYIWIDFEVNVDFAVKGIEEVKKILRTFAERNALLDHFNPSDANPLWYLKYNEKSIRLQPIWSRDGEAEEGVTCRLVKVGESTVTYPQYKLVCDNGEKLEEEVLTNG